MSFVESISIKAGPAARRIAAMRGLSLHAISGTGPRGWITKSDALTATPSDDSENTAAATHSATTAPYFHTTRDIEWPDSAANTLAISAVVQASSAVPKTLSRWTVGGINTPIAPTIIYVDYTTAKPAASRISANAAVSNEAVAKSPLNTFGVSPTDCVIIHDFGASDIASAAVLPMDGVTASVTIAAPRTRAGSRGGGLSIERVRAVTISSDHRVIDGAVAAEWMQRFAEAVEQAACAS